VVVLQTFLDRLASALRVPSLQQYLEVPLHAVQFPANKSSSWAAHHDYRRADAWSLRGYRVLSIYMGLLPTRETARDDSAAQDMGFPDLNWKIVPVEPMQVLIWPNVRTLSRCSGANTQEHQSLPEDPTGTCNGTIEVSRNVRMSWECLASATATATGLILYIRQYPTDSTKPLDPQCH
jgi:hypothetical protein